MRKTLIVILLSTFSFLAFAMDQTPAQTSETQIAPVETKPENNPEPGTEPQPEDLPLVRHESTRLD